MLQSECFCALQDRKNGRRTRLLMTQGFDTNDESVLVWFVIWIGLYTV